MDCDFCHKPIRGHSYERYGKIYHLSPCFARAVRAERRENNAVK